MPFKCKFKTLLFCGFFLLGGHLLSAKEQPITLAAQVYGYGREMVYFDCPQSPLLAAEFHTNPGEDHVYTFSADRLVSFLINGTSEVLLLPGDSLHVVVRYDGRSVRSLDFSGTEAAVRRNRLSQQVARIRQDMRYKTQLLACVAVDVKPKDRLDDSRRLKEQVEELLGKASGVEAEALTYLRAATQASVYESFMEYPVMYAEVRRTPVEQQGIGDYWALMDGVDLSKPQAAALRNPAYVSMLMRHVFYQKEKAAHASGTSYARPKEVEDMYATFAQAFKSPARDAVLFQLLSNYIRGGVQIERAEPLVLDFRKKAKKNKALADILDVMME